MRTFGRQRLGRLVGYGVVVLVMIWMALVPSTHRRGPDHEVGGVAGDGPAGVLVFKPVVTSTERPQIGVGGDAVRFIRFQMVEVAAAGRCLAGGEAADPVAGTDVVGECGGWSVGGAAVVEDG